MLDEVTDVAVDARDQPADFTVGILDHAQLKTFHDACRDPPQAPAVHVETARGDRQQSLAHGAQALRRVLAAKPAQQLLLEMQTQLRQLAAIGLGLFVAQSRWCLLGQERVEIGVEQCRFRQRRLATAGAQVVEQRQQHHRHVTMATGQALKVVGQLHQAAHQHGVGFLAVTDAVGQKFAGQHFHLAGHRGRAMQLDHLQGAACLMQVLGARAHRSAIFGVFDVGLQRLARDRQSLVELGLDPLQGGEIDVVLKSHCVSRALRELPHAAAGLPPVKMRISTGPLSPAA